MKRLVVILAALAALVVPVAASAHPLGNFTINRFSRIEVSGHRLYVVYVLDLAEIPTFQAGRIDAQAYARRIARGAELTVDGRRAALGAGGDRARASRRRGGLRTTRLEVLLARAGGRRRERGRLPRHELRRPHRLEGDRRRRGTRGARATSSAHIRRACSQSPLDVTSVHAPVAPTSAPPPTLTSGSSLQAPDRVADSGFAQLVGREHLGFWVVLASLAAALFWGAAHALSPGHGKSIVTAYLVGRRGTPWHAALLGLIVTATHTVGVFTLGLVTLALSQFVVPGPALPVAQPRVGAARRLDRRLRLRLALASRAGAPHGHHHHHHHHDEQEERRVSARCSPSASRAGCCRARRRSSSCSQRSRCTGSRSDCC